MGRWIDYEIQRGFTDWADLAAAHNADIDDYEARIDALTAELARVKAESLRVVPDDTGNWHMTPSGLGYPGTDRYGNECVETPTDYHAFADCTPVRLERWESDV